MAVPTLPAPAMATFTDRVLGSSAGAGQHLVELAQRVVEHGEVQDVALLADQLARVEPRHAGAGHRDEAQAPGLLELAQRPAGPGVGERAVDQREASRWRRTSRPTSSSGSRRRRTWSMVHVTVATVGMPRRW